MRPLVIATQLLSLLAISIHAHAGAFQVFPMGETASGEQAPGLGLDKYLVAIQESALGQSFLLQAAAIPQRQAWRSYALRGRVIGFKRRGQRLYMLENPRGHMVTPDVSTNLLLAEFPILRESEGTIYFDFNAGMSTLFVAESWNYTDFTQERVYDAGQPFVSVKARVSYIEEAKIMPNKSLLIRQIAQLALPPPKPRQPEVEYVAAPTELEMPVEVRYFLSAYAPDPSFKSVPAMPLDRIGIFETFPAAPGPGIKAPLLSTRHHPAKPITIALAGTIPAPWRAAIEEGARYWNKAFGTEKITLVDAPEGVAAPDPVFSVIQWLDFPSGSIATTTFHSDPLTGEIHRGEVYIPSGYASSSVPALRRLVQNIRVGRESPPTARVALQGLPSSEICEVPLWELPMAQLILEGALTQGETDDRVAERAFQDVLRWLVAHEVGHLLGFRHNFAGSLETNVPVHQRQALFEDYLESDSIPAGTVLGSSVMAYPGRFERPMLGKQIRAGQVFSCDKRAVEVLYEDKPFDPAQTPLFCTDFDRITAKFIDCRPNSAGASFLEFATQARSDLSDSFATDLARKVLSVYNPAGGELQKVRELYQSPTAVASGLLDGQADLFRAFTDTAQILSIRRRFPGLNSFNEAEVRLAEIDYVASEASRLGGARRLLDFAPADFVPTTLARFAERIARLRVLSEQPPLPPQEIGRLALQAVALLQPIHDEMVSQEISIFLGEKDGTTQAGANIFAAAASKAGRVVDHPISASVLQVIAKKVERTIFETRGELVVPGQRGKPVRLPRFYYSPALRARAALALGEERFVAAGMAIQQRAKLRAMLRGKLKQALGADVDDLVLEQASPELARWATENRAVLRNL